MAFTITINFANDTMNNRSKDAFATAYGLTRPDPNNPNQVITMTKTQNRDYRIKEFIKEITKAKEIEAAQAAIVVPVVEN